MWALLGLPRFGGAKHETLTTIGLNIAKSVFQVHGMAWHRSSEGQSAARRHTWHWSGIGDRAGCQRRRSKGVPIRKRLLGLDWAGGEAELEREVRTSSVISASEAIVLPIGTADGVRASRH